tara:strand:- start:41 stop:526 length:486 start_codon:yes stop_codon:yes gene_type:complete
MKFLLFNASVICALYYLFSGFEGFNSEIVKSKVSGVLNDTIMQASRIGDRVKARPIPVEPVRAVEPVMAPKSRFIEENHVSESTTALRELSKNGSTEPQLSEKATKSSHEDDQRLFPPDSKTEAKNIEDKPSDFMSPRQRRRELNKLAEDMELMFISRLAR